MSKDRAILHSDLNSFYASVEIMLNPTLRDKAIAVCGSTEDRHGIVLAKSEKPRKQALGQAWSTGKPDRNVQVSSWFHRNMSII